MDLMDYLRSAKKSIFRFEFLQDFYIPDEQEDFKKYKETRLVDIEMMKEWWDFLEFKHGEGVAASRIRLVRKPFTEYTQWALDTYKESIKHGDNIRILYEEKLTLELGNLKDFWLIDNSVVLSMKYGEAGEYLGFEIDSDISPYIAAKKYLEEVSVDL